MYLLPVCIAWFFAQFLKKLTDKSRGLNLRNIAYTSGGMPSAHSSSVASLATFIGLKDGVGSAIFGLSLLLALIVMYDAMMVRRSVGKQSVVTNQILDKAKYKDIIPLKIVRGHEPMEVLAGAIFGIVVGLVVFFATNL